MTRRLVLLRHGEAADATHDRARPLTPRGLRDAASTATWLMARGFTADRVLASPARRTLETAHAVVGAWKRDAEDVETVDSLYLAEVEDLVTLVGALAVPDRVTLLVGHNPGLSLLVAALADDVPPGLRATGLHPASVAVMDVPDAGDPVGQGALVAHRHPDGMP